MQEIFLKSRQSVCLSLIHRLDCDKMKERKLVIAVTLVYFSASDFEKAVRRGKLEPDDQGK